jgi:hypothetical protein
METIIILFIILCCLFLFISIYYYKEKFSSYDTFSVITNSSKEGKNFIDDLQSQVSSLITNVSTSLSNNPSSSIPLNPQPMSQTTNTQPMSQTTNTQPMSQTTNTQPMSQTTNTQPMSQTTNTQPMSQTTDKVENKTYYNISNSNGIWDGNSPGDYTCPNANNVNTTGGNGKWSEYCIFNNVEDVQNYCNSSQSCLGYVTRDPNMFQATNNPIKDTNGGAYYKKITGNKPKYSYNKKYISGWWDGNKPDEYICPGAINRNITDGNGNWKNYCIFSNEIDAQNYCNSDPSCLGYVMKDKNMFQVTNNPVPDKNGGAYYQKQ